MLTLLIGAGYSNKRWSNSHSTSTLSMWLLYQVKYISGRNNTDRDHVLAIAVTCGT